MIFFNTTLTAIRVDAIISVGIDTDAPDNDYPVLVQLVGGAQTYIDENDARALVDLLRTL